MMSIEDMTELIYIQDAYDELCCALFGEKVAMGFHEGNLGALSRVFQLIYRNTIEELKREDCEDVWKIASDISLTPEERAKQLLGITEE